MSRILEKLNVEIPPRPVAGQLAAFWGNQQDRLASALAECVPHGSRAIYVDYPIHGNVGDQMLMLASECWFQRSGLEILGRWHVDNFRFPKLPPGTIILCNAGGNMGDLYRYQRHREAIVRSYPGHRIVFLPQAIYYRDPERLRRSAEIMRQHGDLHLFLRDRRSFELACAEFATTTVTLAPDMAVFLYPLHHTLNHEFGRIEPRYDVIYLMRRDWEWTNVTPVPKSRRRVGLPDVLSLINPFWKRGRPVSIFTSEKAACIDWFETAPIEMYLAWTILGVVFLVGKVLPAAPFCRGWQRLARRMVIRAAAAVLGCECLVTNRLHAHLMACLLDTPNVLLDNNYGKCSAYFKTWHLELPLCRFLDQGIATANGSDMKGVKAIL
jgi:pyruvyl transferase EpsO